MIVKYSKKFPYAPYLNEDIGFEIEVPDDGDPMMELASLKEMAEKFHKENNPGLYIPVNPEYVNLVPQGAQPIPSIDYKAKEKLEIDIDNATTIEELAVCKEPASQCGLITRYMDKLNVLTNGQVGV